MKWINAIGTIVNSVTAVCAVVLSCIASQEQISLWRGINNLSGFIYFHKEDPFYREPGFLVAIQNKGLTPQNITFIRSDKEDYIYSFIGPKDKPGFTLKKRATTGFFLVITPDILRKLESADSLILFNNIGKNKEIISKKDIQRVLESYKKSK